MTNTKKSGGMFMDDVNKVMVPFGLLLAEKGLSNLMKKDKSKKSPSKKSSVEENKKAAVGGKSKGSKGKKGGNNGTSNLANEFEKLSHQIELFLNKY